MPNDDGGATADYDSPWKTVLERLFPTFLEFFFPVVSLPNYRGRWAELDASAIQFDGVQAAISDSPAAGDTFSVHLATRQDLFATLDRLATALEAGGGTPAKAASPINRSPTPWPIWIRVSAI